MIELLCGSLYLREDTSIKHYARGMVEEDIGRDRSTVFKADVGEAHIVTVADFNVVIGCTGEFPTHHGGPTTALTNKVDILALTNPNTP